ncbi:MAG: DUF4921 family protein [Propionibacteriaceae bacterium]|jgi:galactose-1-phosphate uridylyltransferase|nr:DUF4921 family protein [Propionibacteriaceae bacterium]
MGDALLDPAFLTRMADGTIKQINPSTGTRVWTVPGRGNRPLSEPPTDTRPVSDTAWTHGCIFCSARYMETPPEKARLVKDGDWSLLEELPAEQLFDTVAEFRVVPNLFEIVSYHYWHRNYGFELAGAGLAHKQAYLASEPGRRHVFAVQAAKLRLMGRSAEDIASYDEDQIIAQADGFFAGGHDVVIARRHWRDGATTVADLASAGTLDPDEHEQYIRLTIDTMKKLYDANSHIRYVAVFQNWLKAAGASIDHLHKQLVGIDEPGANTDLALARVTANPNFFNDCGLNYARDHNLVIAENASAIAFAGFGHRFPTIEVYSKSEQVRPWEHSAREIRDMSDLLQALHCALGADIACNEEWHHTPIDIETPMPWRINIKARTSTIAGFEGGTKIYINTLSPQDIYTRITGRLRSLRATGQIADLWIGPQCSRQPNPLRYCLPEPAAAKNHHDEGDD